MTTTYKRQWAKVINAGFGKLIFIGVDGRSYGIHRIDGKYLIPSGDTFATAEDAAAALDFAKLERAWGTRKED